MTETYLSPSRDHRGAVRGAELPQEPGDRGGGGGAPAQAGSAAAQVLEQEEDLMLEGGSFPSTPTPPARTCHAPLAPAPASAATQPAQRRHDPRTAVGPRWG